MPQIETRPLLLRHVTTARIVLAVSITTLLTTAFFGVAPSYVATS
jgi:hypothetical protein